MPRACFKEWSQEDMERILGTANSDELTVEDLQEAIKKAKKRRLDTLKQAAAIKEGVNVVNRSDDSVSNLLGILTRDPAEATNFLSADQRINAIRSSAKANLSAFMSEMAPTTRQIFAGIATGERALTDKQHAMLRSFVHELYGTQTGNGDAQKAAKGWLKATADLNERFKKAGGDISELDDWRLPQKHDRMAVREAGVEEWVGKIWDKLDIPEMKRRMRGNRGKKDAEGKTVLPTDEELKEALASAYNNIVTDGLAGNKVKYKKMKDMFRNERFLRFKDADSWLNYQAEFGDSNVYASLLSHIDHMGRSIGMMETFGPDPDEGYRAMKRAAKLKQPDQKTILADDTFDMMMGYNYADEQSTWAEFFATSRNVFTAAKLGGAAISALTDTVYGAMAARYNGLPPAKVMASMFAEVLKTNRAGRKQWAQDFGFGAEFALDRMVMSSDYLQSFGGNRSQNLAESVMHISGMNRWTNSTRAAFQFEFATALSRAADNAWGELPEKMRRAMERYGLTEAEWDVIRKTPKTKYKTRLMIDPRKMPPEIQSKLIGMVDGEAMMAVPQPDARVRAKMASSTKSGTTGGELVRSMLQYHSFAVTTIMNQWQRLMRGKGYNGATDRVMAAAGMIGALGTLGVGIIQAKEMLAGREPKKWDDPKLWISGFAQGGGLNYVGDFVRNSASGFGHDVTSYVGGSPLDYGNFVVKAGDQALKGEFDKLPATTTNFISSQIPFNNIWYSKLATDRLLMDRIKRLADPEYDKKQIQRMNKMYMESEQDYWWSPPIGG